MAYDTLTELDCASFMGLRYAIRSLSRAPLYSAVVIAILAARIGSNTAIFSVIDAVLLRPLPFPHADRLVRCSTIGIKSGEVYGTSYPDFLDWSERCASFDRLAAARGRSRGSPRSAGGAAPRINPPTPAFSFWRSTNSRSSVPTSPRWPAIAAASHHAPDHRIR